MGTDPLMHYIYIGCHMHVLSNIEQSCIVTLTEQQNMPVKLISIIFICGVSDIFRLNTKSSMALHFGVKCLKI